MLGPFKSGREGPWDHTHRHEMIVLYGAVLLPPPSRAVEHKIGAIDLKVHGFITLKTHLCTARLPWTWFEIPTDTAVAEAWTGKGPGNSAVEGAK